MDIISSTPTIVRLRKNNITILISTYPLITRSNFLERLKKTLNVEESCKDLSLAECFALLYGGIVISANSILERVELEGCFKESDNGDEFEVEKFLKNPYRCFSFDNGKICFSKVKDENCKTIDNIGLRFIIK
ncbi:hypothetical protein [Sulfurisphaera tokodaii]|uniref:Uncharacterized protein n=2 Tax=Sulfurisphaera tokodaii TaxID=111955 RepID=Q974W6_SULTO|nr:hypothetical protein [Sulfurisphaera tokodaii]BAB65541.1 hypothetical protein STK_05440 [Sulfurisphaera tokodaii str. 7]HII74758.1 hypothetical protein [Sulfurisphaera tokodaii]